MNDFRYMKKKFFDHGQKLNEKSSHNVVIVILHVVYVVAKDRTEIATLGTSYCISKQ